MKKPNRKAIKKKLIKLAGDAAMERDNYTCQHCGKGVEGANAHRSHVIPKSHGDIYKWDVQNIKCLCFHCHINWWHLNPIESGQWFRDKFPERAKYLDGLKPRQYKTWELQELLEEMKNDKEVDRINNLFKEKNEDN